MPIKPPYLSQTNKIKLRQRAGSTLTDSTSVFSRHLLWRHITYRRQKKVHICKIAPRIFKTKLGFRFTEYYSVKFHRRTKIWRRSNYFLGLDCGQSIFFSGFSAAVNCSFFSANFNKLKARLRRSNLTAEVRTSTPWILASYLRHHWQCGVVQKFTQNWQCSNIALFPRLRLFNSDSVISIQA